MSLGIDPSPALKTQEDTALYIEALNFYNNTIRCKNLGIKINAADVPLHLLHYASIIGDVQAEADSKKWEI